MSISFYVSANKGSDNNSGTIDSPFKTINYAIQQAILRNDSSGAMIQLEKEIYYLDQTITIQNYNNPISIVGLGKAPTQIIAGVPCDAYISKFGKQTRTGYDIYQIAIPGWNTGQFTMRGNGSSPGSIGYTQPV